MESNIKSKNRKIKQDDKEKETHTSTPCTAPHSRLCVNSQNVYASFRNLNKFIRVQFVSCWFRWHVIRIPPDPQTKFKVRAVQSRDHHQSPREQTRSGTPCPNANPARNVIFSILSGNSHGKTLDKTRKGETMSMQEGRLRALFEGSFSPMVSARIASFTVPIDSDCFDNQSADYGLFYDYIMICLCTMSRRRFKTIISRDRLETS